MAPLRILQIVPSISLVYGGPSQMVLGLAEGLARAGVEVTILTTNTNGDLGQPPLDVPLDRPVWQNGYQIRYFRCAPSRRYKFSLNLLRWLATHAHEFDLAHIHALFSPLSTMTAIVARVQKLPYVLRPLGTLDPADLRKKWWLKQLYAHGIEKYNLANAAAVHFTSLREAETAQRFGVTTCDWVIPLGVSLSAPVTSPEALLNSLNLPSPRSPDRCPLVLFMSRIDRKKGLDLLFPALEKILAEGIEFHFVLAGANPQDSQYERQIRDRLETSPLSTHTTMTGFVFGEVKRSLLQQADLFVLPSYYENFGIAVAEAMTAGVPVVISDQVDLWTDVQQAHGGWVSTCQVDALTAVLRSALTNTEARQQRGDRAQQWAIQHYGWAAIAQQLIVAYEQVLPQPPTAKRVAVVNTPTLPASPPEETLDKTG